MNKSFHSFILLCFALIISVTSAFITVTGLADMYRNAGYLTVLLVAAAIEATRVANIYFISLYWKQLSKWFRIVGCAFILTACTISAVGVSGFFFGAFKDSQTEIQLLETKTSSNTSIIKNIQDQINSNKEVLAGLQVQLENEGNIYNSLKENEDGTQSKQQKNSIYRQRQIQNQITELNKEISKQNSQIIEYSKESAQNSENIVNASPELNRLQSIANMFGLSSVNSLLYLLTLLVILCFDPVGIYLLIFSTKIKTLKDDNFSSINNKQKGKTMKIVSKIKNMFKKQPQVIIPIEEIETVDDVVVEEQPIEQVTEKVVKVSKTNKKKDTKQPTIAKKKDTFSKYVN